MSSRHLCRLYICTTSPTTLCLCNISTNSITPLLFIHLFSSQTLVPSVTAGHKYRLCPTVRKRNLWFRFWAREGYRPFLCQYNMYYYQQRCVYKISNQKILSLLWQHTTTDVFMKYLPKPSNYFHPHKPHSVHKTYPSIIHICGVYVLLQLYMYALYPIFYFRCYNNIQPTLCIYIYT